MTSYALLQVALLSLGHYSPSVSSLYGSLAANRHEQDLIDKSPGESPSNPGLVNLEAKNSDTPKQTLISYRKLSNAGPPKG